MAAPDLTEAQRKLFNLIRAKNGQEVQVAELLQLTGWKPATWRSYWSKGVFAPFFVEGSDGSLQIRAAADLDEWGFQRQVTQTASAREVGAPCSSALARALVKKSRDNMTLALELYNRPSLENRLDAFCILFCTAWEQLLKAELIEQQGEETIFRAKVPNRRQETISLDQTMEKVFAPNDLVKANIARIEDLRHGATHLLMPEVQSVLSRLFQAGVLNFAQRYQPLAGHSLFPTGSTGLMSLIGEMQQLNVIALRQTYGTRVADDIKALVDSLESSITATADDRYAISVEYKLVLSKTESKGDIRLTTYPDAEGTLKIVEKPVNFTVTHKLRPSQLAKAVAKATSKTLNLHQIQSAIYVEKWKHGNNEYHFLQEELGYHWYSEKAATVLASKISQDESYIARAQASYGSHTKKQNLLKKETLQKSATTKT